MRRNICILYNNIFQWIQAIIKIPALQSIQNEEKKKKHHPQTNFLLSNHEIQSNLFHVNLYEMVKWTQNTICLNICAYYFLERFYVTVLEVYSDKVIR